MLGLLPGGAGDTAIAGFATIDDGVVEAVTNEVDERAEELVRDL